MKCIFIALVAITTVCALACGGDSENVEPTAAPAATTVPATSAATVRVTAATTPVPAGTGFGDLSLVYLDRSKGQGTEVFTATADGATPKKVGALTGPARALDLRGKTLAYSADNQLTFLNLVDGGTTPITTTGTISSGRFLNDTTFIYTTSGGCGPQRSTVMSVDLRSMQQRELVGLTGNLSIAGIDAATSTVAVVPRGCDPGVQFTVLYGTADGREMAKLNTPGCGGVSGNVAKKQVIVSWTYCTLETGTSPQATLYDYSGATLTKKDIVGPSGGINLSPILLRPNANEAAIATKAPGPSSGPNAARASGVWQLDLAALSTSVLVPGEGAEQAPIAWTADGRYLLVQNVEAQGMCSYVIADATNKQVKPINKDITFCGVNGEVIGWTSLK